MKTSRKCGYLDLKMNQQPLKPIGYTLSTLSCEIMHDNTNFSKIVVTAEIQLKKYKN